MELGIGNGHPTKAMELFIENAQLTGSSNDWPSGLNVFGTLMLWLLECGRFKLIAPHLGRSYSHFNVLAQLPIGPLVGGCSNASEQSCCEWVGDY